MKNTESTTRVITRDGSILPLTAAETERIPIIRNLCALCEGSDDIPLNIDKGIIIGLVALARSEKESNMHLEPLGMDNPKRTDDDDKRIESIMKEDRIIDAIHAADFLGMDETLDKLYFRLRTFMQEIPVSRIAPMIDREVFLV